MAHGDCSQRMRTYQARFDIDYSLRLLRCLPPGEQIADHPHAVLRFDDTIQLLNLIRQAGLPEEILHGRGPKTAWIVTFQQLAILGFTGSQLQTLGIFP